MYDIITFGSASQDIFLKSDGFEEIKQEKKFITKKGVCFVLGGKIPVSEIAFSTGGGGTNTAFSFKNFGFKTVYCGTVGDDFPGLQVKCELEEKGMPTNLIFTDVRKLTNYSAIILTKNDRTALVYRGASEELKKIPFEKLKTKWIYLAPLSGKLGNQFGKIVRFCSKNKIKIAVNPGNKQLSLPKNNLKKIFSLVDVLVLNQEESQIAAKMRCYDEEKLLKTLSKWTKGIVVITKGPLGIICTDGKYIYECAALKSNKVIDRTGAGDAFSSGFVSGIMASKTIEDAIQIGLSNATSCIGKFGAKQGLLKKTDNLYKWGKAKIKKTVLK
jgi:sugar/nucleoside kinase (ribokinase family)